MACGIRRAFGRDVAVEAFVVEEDRDAEARVVFEPLLDGVGELDHCARVAMFAGARDFADAVFQEDGGVVGEEGALVIDEEQIGVGEELFVLPSAFELRDFFFERHAREEIGDALFDGEFGVAVRRVRWWLLLLRRTLRVCVASGECGYQRDQRNHEQNCRKSENIPQNTLHELFLCLQLKNCVVRYHDR